MSTCNSANQETGSESDSDDDAPPLDDQNISGPSVAVIPNDAVIFENKPNSLGNTGLTEPVIFNTCSVLENRPDKGEHFAASVAIIPNAIDHSIE